MRTIAFHILASFCAYASDTISLSDGTQLTGEIREVNSNGTLLMDAEVSLEPLFIDHSQVNTVVLKDENREAANTSQRIHLSNGDHVKVKILSLSDGFFTVESPTLGIMRVPRDYVRSMTPNCHENRPIYSGKDQLSHWTKKGVRKRSWLLADDEFKNCGTGEISRNMDLPDNFIFQFTFSHLELIDFELRLGGESHLCEDSYALRLKGTTLSFFALKKDTAQRPIFMTSEGIGQSCDVKISISRLTGKIELCANQALLGRFIDDVVSMPKGSYVLMSGKGTKDDPQYVQNLYIYEWNQRAVPYSSVTKGRKNSDVLLGNFGERITGYLEKIRYSDSSSNYEFKLDGSQEMIRMAAEDISQLILAEKKIKLTTEGQRFSIFFHDGGSLKVQNWAMNENQIFLRHAILGNLKALKSDIASIHRILSDHAKNE